MNPIRALSAADRRFPQISQNYQSPQLCTEAAERPVKFHHPAFFEISNEYFAEEARARFCCRRRRLRRPPPDRDASDRERRRRPSPPLSTASACFKRGIGHHLCKEASKSSAVVVSPRALRASHQSPRPWMSRARDVARKKKKRRLIIARRFRARSHPHHRGGFTVETGRDERGSRRRLGRHRQARPDAPPGARSRHACSGRHSLDRSGQGRPGGKDRR